MKNINKYILVKANDDGKKIIIIIFEERFKILNGKNIVYIFEEVIIMFDLLFNKNYFSEK